MTKILIGYAFICVATVAVIAVCWLISDGPARIKRIARIINGSKEKIYCGDIILAVWAVLNAISFAVITYCYFRVRVDAQFDIFAWKYFSPVMIAALAMVMLNVVVFLGGIDGDTSRHRTITKEEEIASDVKIEVEPFANKCDSLVVFVSDDQRQRIYYVKEKDLYIDESLQRTDGVYRDCIFKATTESCCVFNYNYNPPQFIKTIDVSHKYAVLPKEKVSSTPTGR